MKRLKLQLSGMLVIAYAGVLHQPALGQDKETPMSLKISYDGVKPAINMHSLRCNDYNFFDHHKYISGINIEKSWMFRLKEKNPVVVSLSPFLGSQKFGFSDAVLLEPGNNISVTITKDSLVLSGAGSEKLHFLTAFHKQAASLISPENKKASDVINLDDFQKWNTYIDQQEQLLDNLAKSFRPKLSEFSLNYLKAQIIGKLEYQRVLRFSILEGEREKLGLEISKVKAIFEQIFSGRQTKWLFNYSGPTYHGYGFYEYARQLTLYKCNFDKSHSSVTGFKRTLAYYNAASSLFRGDALQNCLFFLITQKGIKEHTFKYGYVEEFEELLSRYYRESSQYPINIDFVKKFDERYHRYLLAIGQKGYNFKVSGINGNPVSLESFEGRLLLINFWNPNDEKSTQTAKLLVKVVQELKSEPGVAVVNISTEKNKAKWAAQTKKYRLDKLENLYTNGLGNQHPVFKAYGVMGYPKGVLLNANGRSLYNPDGPYSLLMYEGAIFPDPLKDNGAELIAAIKRQLAALDDGPYVFGVSWGKIAYSIQDRKVKRINPLALEVQSDVIGMTFKVNLQQNYSAEAAESTRSDKVFALSDIEGNLSKLRLLLQNNGIIDGNFDWTFGKGHLVFSGDMFDRGSQVTECLWLIYSLEEKAKLAGGRVHFILGNHEIMNLQGDHRYVHDKYRMTAKKLEKSLTELYDEDTELGRWLRTKNIVEKIGELLFVHGGLSSQINRSSMSVSDMNKLARPFYGNKKENYGDANTNLVMSQTYGPFWYRGYYDAKTNPAAAVDSILTKYNAKHIVTGHTIIADTISVLYDNKVINTDVPHAKDKSEALLVEGNNYYRVSDKGQRWLLFKDPEDKP
ncbi:MAG: metallophosphoesterase [Bacteroidota bacterium]